MHNEVFADANQWTDPLPKSMMGGVDSQETNAQVNPSANPEAPSLGPIRGETHLKSNSERGAQSWPGDSVVEASSRALKGCGFDPQSKHMQEAPNQCLSHISVSLSPPPSLYKINKYTLR